jgi:predicted ATPase/transcriptional regulator with XRE-family HTH domain
MAEIQSFGQWLRYRRRELDLTQEALSRTVGCAQVTIRKMEADLLRPSRQMAELLIEKLGIPPEKRESYLLFARSGSLPAPVSPPPILPTAIPPPAIPPPTPHNHLPHSLTSFIGRAGELEEVPRLLASSRLVTVTGSGGTGKTRLALEVAAEALARYPDGVWFIELSAITDPDLVPETVAVTLGVQKTGEVSYQSVLNHYLQDKHLLLMLDTCEHVLDACARLVDGLLRQCPKVSILATSREPLGMVGEKTYRVPSLTALDPDIVSDPHQLEQTDSIRLFAERAAAVLPDFKLTDATIPAVARICHRLDGIPLAIELAAARISVLNVEQIAARLADRFWLLANGSRIALPRQRTLRASIDWSYSLLTDADRLLFQRLSIFGGGWTLEAAEQVCAFDPLERWEILEGLASLVNKSLVVADNLSGIKTRYRMLDTIRQYAREKLAGEKLTREKLTGEKLTREKLTGQKLTREKLAGEKLAEEKGEVLGEGEKASDQHLAYFLALSREYGPFLKTAQVTAYLDLLDPEIDNLRAALTWALGKNSSAGAEAALEMLCALAYFWAIRGFYWEIFPRFKRALELLSASNDSLMERKAWGLYTLAALQTDFNIEMEIVGYLNQSIPLFRRVGSRQGLALALALRSYLNFRHNSFFPPDPALPKAEAQRDQDESIAIAQALSINPGDDIQRVIAWVDSWNGAGEVFRPDPARARALGRKVQEACQKLGDTLGEQYGLLEWLMSSISLGDTAVLIPQIQHAIALAQRINHKRYLSFFIHQMVTVLFILDRYPEMEVYARQGLLLQRQMGAPLGEVENHFFLGLAYTHLTNFPQALKHFRDGLHLLTIEMNYKDPFNLLDILLGYAVLAGQTLQYAYAARFLGFVEGQFERFSRKITGLKQREFYRCKEKSQAGMREIEFESLCQQGREMTMEQAVTLAWGLDLEAI